MTHGLRLLEDRRGHERTGLQQAAAFQFEDVAFRHDERPFVQTIAKTVGHVFHRSRGRHPVPSGRKRKLRHAAEL